MYHGEANRIMDAVSRYYGVDLGKARFIGKGKPVLTRARVAACYLMHERTKLTFCEIAKVVGYRDHTTVSRNVKMVGALYAEM